MERNKQTDEDWHKSLVEKLATDALKERRRARRWGIFFKLLTFAYLALLLVLLIPEDWSDSAMSKEEHTALVKLEGVIAPGQKGEADTVVTGLRDAFEDEKTKAVILRINSPGGSPVQSSDMHKEILRLREKYPDIPLYAVVSDICASGGYYVASAADEIFVNESSIVGSIGVLMNGFGFVDAMDELGIERRLKGDDETLFNGLFWSGRESIELGLADAIGSAGYVAREVIGVEEIVDFTHKEDALSRLVDRLGAAVGAAFARVTGLDGVQLR